MTGSELCDIWDGPTEQTSRCLAERYQRCRGCGSRRRRVPEEEMNPSQGRNNQVDRPISRRQGVFDLGLDLIGRGVADLKMAIRPLCPALEDGALRVSQRDHRFVCSRGEVISCG
jgi:hypothetical protein